MDKIQEIKDKYGNLAESIIADGLALKKVGKKYRCPNTHAHKNGDRNPSMSWDSNLNQYHCFTCGMNIDLYGYYREHLNYTHNDIISNLLGIEKHEQSKIYESRETFKSEINKITELNDECRAYISKRGIKLDIAQYFKLGTYKNMIAFPYFRYETVVGYKTRKPVKNPGSPKMLSIAGSKPYLFNAQNIDLDNKELIICEGEFDCMMIHQCGFTNVVSVGAGANSLSSLLEQAEDFLKNFEIFIIVSDNDDAGTDMDRKLVEAFGDKAKLIDKKLYTRKDINEQYFFGGCEKIAEIIESARFKIEGRRDLDKTPYKGLVKKGGSYIPTGIDMVDNAINDLAPGLLTLITGRSNGGKTTFVKQIIANAIDKDNKVYLMNGENDPELLLNEFYQTVIGRDEQYYNIVKLNRKWRKEPNPETLEKLKKWHSNKFYMFNKGESKIKDIKELLKMLEMEIKFNQYNLVVIDNLMSILSVRTNDEKFNQQADFVQELCNLAKAYNTHIILVLHPNKTYVKGNDMDFEQISGASDIYNKADNIIAVIRYDDAEKKEQKKDGAIQVLKNRYYSELPKVETHFDKETGLLLEHQGETILGYSFKWNGGNNEMREVVSVEGMQEEIQIPF
jgi:5S rRNA maturation endonuclease (ribonuclease M5)/archaellum biogenesis ATPase FlaH